MCYYLMLLSFLIRNKVKMWRIERLEKLATYLEKDQRNRMFRMGVGNVKPLAKDISKR